MLAASPARRSRPPAPVLSRHLAATRDATTGLLTRKAFEAVVAWALRRARLLGESTGVVCVVLEPPEADAGGSPRRRDAALRLAAEALAGAVRGEDALGRTAQEELSVLVPGAGDADLATLALRLAGALAAEPAVGSLPLGRVGWAVAPAGADRPPAPADLLAAARSRLT